MIVCVFDTETTGLIDNHSVKLDRQPEVIEFAAAWVDWEDLTTLVIQYSTLIKPSKELPDKIKEITHLDDSDLAGCPSFASVSDRIASLLTEADAVCGHNLSYDMEMIDLEFERLGKRLTWPQQRICTVEQTIHIKGDRISLGDLHLLLTGALHVDAHRAMPDVMATLRCLTEIKARDWL
jgi:DNA polymerase III epsilon subunit-like protein